MSTSVQSNLSKLELLAYENDSELRHLIESTDPATLSAILYDWRWNARPSQLRPGTPGALNRRTDWRYWLCLAGRGWGKTRVGAETVREWAEDSTERILMIAPTSSDVRDVMIEGPSGLMSCYPAHRRPVYLPTRHIVQFPSGAIGITRSADEPERLRGPQFRKFWFDELAACRFAQEAWDQIMFGFRKPDAALQGLITTTPKPIAVLKALIANARTVVTKGSSDENRANLAPEYISDVIDPYRGTRLGRQEIEAELLSDVPGALWTRDLIDQHRIKSIDVRVNLIVRIVIAVDPAVSHHENSDLTGIIVAALTPTGHVLILNDLSCRKSPLGWATVVVEAYRRHMADRVVGECNNGGDLVESNLRAVDPHVSYSSVWASEGKRKRAEPVASCYERGLVHHVGAHTALEDEMCTWTPKGEIEGASAAPSPNRMDAVVWAVTELLLQPNDQPAVVQFNQPYQIRP
jgi:phage terminase large subunit-like protein